MEDHNQGKPAPARHLQGNEMRPFAFAVRWDLSGFHISTLWRVGSGCPNHENHLQDGLSKLSLMPMQLIPHAKIFGVIIWQKWK
jgi:hypothetical protein